jgi:hypothetical protein
LTEEEISLMVQAAQIISLEQGVRFLTDYLECDSYYRCEPGRPKQNLERARVQLKLVADMEEHVEEMTRVVREAWKGGGES